MHDAPNIFCKFLRIYKKVTCPDIFCTQRKKETYTTKKTIKELQKQEVSHNAWKWTRTPEELWAGCGIFCPEPFNKETEKQTDRQLHTDPTAL